MSVDDIASQVGIVLGAPFTLMSPILVAGLTIAMRFILDDCCARTTSGHAAAPPRMVMKSRRLTLSPMEACRVQ
jgi:hypothetical protein